MDEDHRELLRRLFAAATELTETAHEAAIAGQSETLSDACRPSSRQTSSHGRRPTTLNTTGSQ